MAIPLRRLLRPIEAALLLGVKPQTLAAWRHYGKHPDLPPVRIGRQIRYRQEDVERFIQSHVARASI